MQAENNSNNNKSEHSAIRCPICNHDMTSIQACHVFCHNCGSHLDCSDKGTYW